MSKNGASTLRELAIQFLSEVAPKEVQDLDRLFEQWKCDLPRKQEVNFQLSMPPTMREQVLRQIGLGTPDPDPGQNKFLGYLQVLNRLTSMDVRQLLKLPLAKLTALIWQEGRNVGLQDAEINGLAHILPPWIHRIADKATFELSPLNVIDMTTGNRDAAEIRSTVLFKGIIGQSEKMQSVFSCLEKISSSNLSILIQGESGTGKELVAHAIHSSSPRASENFIPVNCGALPDGIIESELFGHEKGAFTGALAQKTGYFEIANRGTIFLDEISETSLNTQVKLLRVLQERVIRRVGGIKPINVDIRVIAATNRDLLTAVREANFRHDLFYRVNEMTITLPPLRERQEDLPLLVEHFLARFSQENRRAQPRLAPETMRLLQSYRWPGNIRELENALKRATVMADEVILPQHLPQTLLGQPAVVSSVVSGAPADDSTAGTLAAQLSSAERKIIARALARNAFNVSAAAVELGVSRRTLQRKMSILGVGRPHPASNVKP